MRSSATLILDGDAIQEGEEGIDGRDPVLDAAAGRAKAVDDDERGTERGGHFQQAVLAGGRVEIEHSRWPTGRGGQHGEEMAAVHAPGHGAGVEELGRGLGVDVDDIGAGRSRRGAVGPGQAGDEAMGEIEGEVALAGAGRGAEEGDHAARDPAGPEPGDGRDAGGELVEGRERGERAGRFTGGS